MRCKYRRNIFINMVLQYWYIIVLSDITLDISVYRALSVITDSVTSPI